MYHCDTILALAHTSDSRCICCNLHCMQVENASTFKGEYKQSSTVMKL